ncbi:leucine-rich repeat-containing protein kinase family protein [Marinagarivorans cellulosilyticus]|uniref:Protein kinase domain-containing protein n=1 Tax=Marinagarivorans cellulosilyticus TaxID=2721545 RepID=A0AAN1WHJ1_9GAMM|nr:leucine-rich repeat-containing protein kinase family protein [Marinagarivorans cellulosilyticus]BCD97640.1 hypothetical protein MARGE09_P1841 [Marinagarivorans cellulosilyticus]
MQTLVQLKAGELAGESRLTLSEDLSEFPTEIYNLAESLEVLDLSGNQLSSLPDDFHRLRHLKVLFLSNNVFEVFPSVLGRCERLEMIGFKSNRIVSVPEGALPQQTRWLILTDNCITALPEGIGSLVRLQKLMLAGNQLQQLPTSIKRCKNLQLVRISANRLQHFPEQLLELPRLAWLAFAGNPFCQSTEPPQELPEVEFDDLVLSDVLGSGASGVISRAHWKKNLFNFPAGVAVKCFKSGVTSDGYVQDELRATLLAGQHHNLVSPLASIAGKGLVMRLIPGEYTNLAGPPSFASCTRDRFPAELKLPLALVVSMVAQIESVVEHLHSRNLCHGDIYAHNMLLSEGSGHVLFGDFGAASFYGGLTDSVRGGILRIERRALGFFIEDLLTVCDNSGVDGEQYLQLQQKARAYLA